MKFSHAARGTRAERDVTLPQPGRAPAMPLVVRPLTGLEEAEVVQKAREFATSRGLTDPKEGEPLYDLAVMVHTLVLGCLDADSPKDARQPFFDGGAPQVLEHLARESIAYLYERHQAWQDECSPYMRRLGAGELLDITARIAQEEPDYFFTRLSPGLRASWARSMARQLLDLLGLKSLYGSPYEPDGRSSSREPGPSSEAMQDDPGSSRAST